jgi:hypothetical protein
MHFREVGSTEFEHQMSRFASGLKDENVGTLDAPSVLCVSGSPCLCGHLNRRFQDDNPRGEFPEGGPNIRLGNSDCVASQRRKNQDALLTKRQRPALV